MDLLKSKLTEENFEKLNLLGNKKINAFIADAIELTEPDSVFVCTDADEDIEYIRQLALKNGEEQPLDIKGHTYHFDGY
ncbi:MAG: phosphoenolpyruvate carboxykinase, partial [Planctomycetes bacterium]|nr:phosphoenolpyruvate carboxykinase [Planctomycetota bacterium]